MKIFLVKIAFKYTDVTADYYVEAENRNVAINKCCAPFLGAKTIVPDLKRCKTKQISFDVPVRV